MKKLITAILLLAAINVFGASVPKVWTAGTTHFRMVCVPVVSYKNNPPQWTEVVVATSQSGSIAMVSLGINQFVDNSSCDLKGKDD